MKIEIYSPTIRRKEMDAVLTAMVEEKIGPGERSKLLIQTAKEHLKFDYALALRSPAVALHLALKALMDLHRMKPVLNTAEGLKTESLCRKQGVVISALSPRYYLNVLEDLELVPVFCDVSFDFPCMSREGVETVLAKKPPDTEVKAIILTHTLGFVPDSASICELGIPVIEDVSQSSIFQGTGNREQGIGKSEEGTESESKEGRTESKPLFFGTYCILGLEERDMLTAGGGALLFSMNKKDSSLLKNFSYLPDEYCLPDINAALAVVQFKELNKNLEKRKEIANVYLQASLRTRHKRFIMRDTEDPCLYSFSMVLETGIKDVIAYAKKKDIILENAFERTIAASKTIGAVSEDCPVSNSIALRTVLFPMYPRLSSKDADAVSKLIMTLP